jgi:hypothetical protein
MDAAKYRHAISGIIALAAGATIALTAWSAPFAAQTASTAIVPFSDFVNSLSVAPADAYVGRSGAEVESTAAFGAMRQHLVKMYSGVAVAHSFVRDDQVFDCFPINDQPGLRLRKLKRVAEPPPSPPTDVLGQEHESGSPNVGETQGTADRPDVLGREQRCEDGTIPVRRLTLDELTRFKTLKSYFAKGPQGAGRVYTGREPPPAFNGHSYAHAYQNVTNYGGYSRLNAYAVASGWISIL